MPVHLYGQMVNMERLKSLTLGSKIKLLEDSAHCIEGSRSGYKPGKYGDAAVFSFYATKNLTCGDGGAVVTNDDDLAEMLRELRLHGMDKSALDRYTKKYSHWDMKILGYKANLPDVNACLLLPQLSRIDKIHERRKSAYQYYEKQFSSLNIERPHISEEVSQAHHLYTIWVPKGKDRDMMIYKLQDAGIGVAVNFRPVHTMTYYKNKYPEIGSIPNAEDIGNKTISIPFFPDIQVKEQDYVIQTIEKIIG
jgi:dTDP-4-amino-4,6-dideoxygalactose transaminase